MGDSLYLLYAVIAFTIFMHIWMTVHYLKYEKILKSNVNSGVDNSDFELLSDLKDEHHQNTNNTLEVAKISENKLKFILYLFGRVEVNFFQKTGRYFFDSFLDMYHNNMIGVVYIGAGFLIITVGLRGIGELQGWAPWLIEETNSRFALKYVLLALGMEFCLVVNLGLMMIYTPEIRTLALRNLLRAFGKALIEDKPGDEKSQYSLKTDIRVVTINNVPIDVKGISELQEQTKILKRLTNQEGDPLTLNTKDKEQTKILNRLTNQEGEPLTLNTKDKDQIKLLEPISQIAGKLQEVIGLINSNSILLSSKNDELIKLQKMTNEINQRIEDGLKHICDPENKMTVKTKDKELIELQKQTYAIIQKLDKILK